MGAPQSTLELVGNRIEGTCLKRTLKSLESDRGGEGRWARLRKQEKDGNGSVLGSRLLWDGREMDVSL